MMRPFPDDSTESSPEIFSGGGRVTWTSFCYESILEEKNSTLPPLPFQKVHKPEEILCHLLCSDIYEFSSIKGKKYKKYLSDPLTYKKKWQVDELEETEKEFNEIIKICEIWIAANPSISAKVEANLKEFKAKIQECKA
jgi:hypothetical protein